MMQAYKRVTSRDALVAALKAMFEHPQWFMPDIRQSGPQVAAKRVAPAFETMLSTHREHIPLRVDGRPVPDEINTEDFFR